MVKNKLNIMMEGWVDTILKYDFTTVYLSRKQNGFADALSRSHDTLSLEVRAKGALISEMTLSSLKLSDTLAMEAEKRGKNIPEESIRAELVDKAHRLGHFSVETMYRTLWNKGYWWPGMRNQLKKAVLSCIG